VVEVEVTCRETFRSSKGKTVTVTAVIREGRVVEARLTGDFFVSDDSLFERLEATLSGRDCEGLKSLRLPRVLIGADEGEVVRALLRCLNC
jgi:hypothetical protein